MDFQPKGIIPAMVTPVTPDGKINVEALRKLTRYLIDGGVHASFLLEARESFMPSLLRKRKESSRWLSMRTEVEFQFMQEQEPSRPVKPLL